MSVRPIFLSKIKTSEHASGDASLWKFLAKWPSQIPNFFFELVCEHAGDPVHSGLQFNSHLFLYLQKLEVPALKAEMVFCGGSDWDLTGRKSVPVGGAHLLYSFRNFQLFVVLIRFFA